MSKVSEEKLLGNKIRYYRKKQGLSQKELGAQLGVTDKAISKWENGSSSPTTETLCELSRIFNVELNEFIKEEKNEKNRKDPFVRRERHKGMGSIAQLFKIGNGPSSSHSIGPEMAAFRFKEEYADADHIVVTLYGSLARTGKGNRTDFILHSSLSPIKTDVVFDSLDNSYPHPNTLKFVAYNEDNEEIGTWVVYSIGGGDIVIEGKEEKIKPVYPHDTFAEIASYCKNEHLRISEYVHQYESKEVFDHLKKCWDVMKESIYAGLRASGTLHGGLGVQKKAKYLWNQRHIDESPETRESRHVCAYAYAVSEQNASSGLIVTAPTCGACGVLPAVLYYTQKKKKFTDEQIVDALATAGIIGNLIKTNASISGAECGCQAEIGTACAMAAAALCELYEMTIDQIEYAAELSIEHHLGLTCDPIRGLVQIPCIERNAVAALRAIDALSLASFLSENRKISFDLVVETMYETGRDLSRNYKETSEGGLAKLYN